MAGSARRRDAADRRRPAYLRSQACLRGQAHASVRGPARATPPTGAAAQPARGAAFGGLSAIQVADGLRGPVVLKATSSGRRIAARWTALATLPPRPARADS